MRISKMSQSRKEASGGPGGGGPSPLDAEPNTSPLPRHSAGKVRIKTSRILAMGTPLSKLMANGSNTAPWHHQHCTDTNIAEKIPYRRIAVKRVRVAAAALDASGSQDGRPRGGRRVLSATLPDFPCRDLPSPRDLPG